MNIKHCRRCKGIFHYVNSDYCPKCLEHFEECFETVRRYVSDNPSANFNQVVEETEVEDKIILSFIREGRIKFTNPNMGIPCEICGSRIAFGRYCENCSTKVKEKLEATKRMLEKSRKDLAVKHTLHLRKN